MVRRMDAELREHLIDFEVKLAFQDRLIRDLDALVREFADRLDKAERRITQLEATVRTGEPAAGPANEKPPHY
jgi:uncharacterized coiled-coil protein SlyX